MIRLALIFGTLSVIAILAFNNCSSGFNVAGPAGLSTASSQCRAKIMKSASPLIFKDERVCEEPAHYHCDRRRFRPGTGGEQSQTTLCPVIAGIGKACVSVVTYDFDTSSQQVHAAAEDLVEGGAYNREEVSCINTHVLHQQVAVIQEQGATVAEALEKSIESCRQRSRP